MPTLTTPRLLLRPWQMTDLDDLYMYSQSPLVGPMAGWKPHETREEAEAALRSYLTQEHHFAIVLREKHCVIGAVKLNPDENRGRYFAKSLSYVLSPAYRGRGYMTEAVQAVIGYAFDTLGVELLSAFHKTENPQSGKVLARCGFTCEGTIYRARREYDGTVSDLVIWSLERSDGPSD